MNNTFVISDTHFGHANIIEYCNRPFETVEEMDSYMINQWNKTVKDNDIVIHLGDFAFGTGEEIRKYASQLNGKKILVQGNHDRKGIGFFESCGFTVWKKGSLLPIIKNGLIYDYILSHAPLDNIEVPEGYINCFGHIHNSLLQEKYNKDNHMCVSVELVDYTPLKIN